MNTIVRKSLVSALGLAAIYISGCSVAAAPDSTTESAVGENTQALISNHHEVTPDGVRFIDVAALGSGCPADVDSWSADISPDGQTLTVNFSEYEANIAPGQVIAVKNCNLRINMKIPQGLTYAVQTFDYAGYVFLDTPGMVAKQRAAYYFQGDRLEAERGMTAWAGPVDKEYVVRDTVASLDLVWKPCNVERTLNVPTSLTIRNNPDKTGSGHIDTVSMDGAIRFVFNLAWRECS